MFGVSSTELLVVLVVALLVLGPKRLPEVARTLGKLMHEFRRAQSNFTRALDAEFSSLEGRPVSPNLRPPPPGALPVGEAPSNPETAPPAKEPPQEHE